MNNLLKDFLKVLLISLAIPGVYFVLAQTYQAPTASPPGNNRPAPLTLDAYGNLNVPGAVNVSGFNYKGFDVNFKRELRFSEQVSSNWELQYNYCYSPEGYRYQCYPPSLDTCNSDTGYPFSCPNIPPGSGDFGCKDWAGSYTLFGNYSGMYSRDVTCKYAPTGPVTTY